MSKILTGVFVIISLLGCAGVEIRKATADDEGLRYYRPWPYLWITLDSDGKCTTSIMYLPDRSQEYIMIPHSGFGSITFKPTLQDGWNLVALDSTADTKVAETLTAIAGIAKSATPAGQNFQPDQEVAPPEILGPGLYRLIFEKDKEDSSYGHINNVEIIFQTRGADNQALACSMPAQREKKKTK